jgi:hypothetical protein
MWVSYPIPTKKVGTDVYYKMFPIQYVFAFMSQNWLHSFKIFSFIQFES